MTFLKNHVFPIAAALFALALIGVLLWYNWPWADRAKDVPTAQRVQTDVPAKPPLAADPPPGDWVIAPGAEVDRANEEVLRELLAKHRTTYEQLKARARKALEVPFRDYPAAPAKTGP